MWSGEPDVAGSAREGDAAAGDRREGAANAYLPEFAADFSRRFGAAPREAEDAHRPVLHDAEELDLILCEQATRKLSIADLTQTLQEIKLQVP